MGSATPSSPSTAAYTKKIDYNYDDDGNRTSVVATPYQQTATTTSYTTNALYQYTRVGGTTHSWDANGNLSDNGMFLFEYNYKNLPVYVRLKSNSNLVATYRYDALGRRVEKDLGSLNEQRYIYSGLETIATYNAYDTWKQDLVYAQGIDRIVMLEQADILDYDSDQNTTETTRSFYHRNALGSVMEITDANEATVVSYRYDPYGALTITRGGQTRSVDPLGQHWTFTGRFHDQETGLYYCRVRHCDPARGRFVQRDPVGYAEGQNLYQYVSSSPPNRSDPLGLREAIGAGEGGTGTVDVDPDDPGVMHSVRHIMDRRQVKMICALPSKTCICTHSSEMGIQIKYWLFWMDLTITKLGPTTYRLGACWRGRDCERDCLNFAKARRLTIGITYGPVRPAGASLGGLTFPTRGVDRGWMEASCE